MRNIDKRPYRADGGDIGTGRIREIADNPYGDEEKCWLGKRVIALQAELEASQSENDRLAKTLIERNGEPVEGLVKRVAELEEIATDYGMKFQRAQDALKHQSLLHKSEMEAAEKRIAELSHHLQSAHAFIEHTEAFGHEASNGILCCGDAQWNIDASKLALAAAGKGE
ncbi:hypothetical protein [Escherichia coli]|uniref:hypothetical protein n=1 Tax=Escherichia coli TaxID=562 RepID=UPI00207BFE93|nr:hypothetical protein [Escherichia coli]